MQLFRAIDIGSNAVRIKTWRLPPDASPEEFDFRRFPIRLGASVFTGGRLDDESVLQRLAVVLLDAARPIDGIPPVVRAVATSALREAANREEVRARLLADSGIDIRILGGDEEARLTARAALGQDAVADRHYLLLDTGGGSTEVIRTRGIEVLASGSIPIGSVRVVRRCWPAADIPSPEQLQAGKSMIDAALDAAEWLPAANPSEPPEGIGLAGTFRTLARMQNPGAATLTRAWLEEAIGRLARMPHAAIAQAYPIEPDRAEVILAGAMIADRLLARLGLDRLRATAQGIADGLLEEFLAESQ